MAGIQVMAVLCLVGVSVCQVCQTESGDKPVGAIWEENCQMCRCQSVEGTVSAVCVPSMCPPPEIACLEWETSGCCPVCKRKGCRDGDNTYSIGYRNTPDPCTTCTCEESGDYVCMALSCMIPQPDCRVTPQHELECCHLKLTEGTCCGFEQICPPGFHSE